MTPQHQDSLSSPARLNDAGLAELVACPTCDSLHRVVAVAANRRARCRRCQSVLLAPRDGAMTKIVMLSFTATVLLIAAISFPFLRSKR
jgi:paraquat-inducible protein A